MAKELLIPIRDCKLYAQLVGKNNGKPTIVLEAGYGDYSKAWDSVIREVSLLSNVLIYDRAGLGKSESSLNRRTSREMIKELKELLMKAKIEPPYILVGHSFGGVNARLYATEYPNDVCGLLLVDSTPEDYKEKFLPSMSKEFQQAYNKQFVYEGNYDEFMESLKQLKQSKRQLDIPLIVLAAGKKAHYSEQSQMLWNEMQKDISTISSNSTFIIAENSTHYIQNDEPEVVVSAIRTLLDNS
ncbi:alpha/beta fold hydrolase [Halalkalibacter krulwichiae]|uniref:Haloalkane dehalogenase n=1 Tax=Halalkalibacter krulwichiae TaxID=199441 RepID=A0A1X9MJS1_9BACI|nr:alpha/beta hydrolase [Halalkalibacter krulwichiae]ARK32533.1 haloalkane dehalogenase [Halalkalibacter krulwichiae]